MNVNRLIEELLHGLDQAEEQYERHAQSGDCVLTGIYAAKCNAWTGAIAIVKRHAEEDTNG